MVGEQPQHLVIHLLPFPAQRRIHVTPGGAADHLPAAIQVFLIRSCAACSVIRRLCFAFRAPGHPRHFFTPCSPIAGIRVFFPAGHTLSHRSLHFAGCAVLCRISCLLPVPQFSDRVGRSARCGCRQKQDQCHRKKHMASSLPDPSLFPQSFPPGSVSLRLSYKKLLHQRCKRLLIRAAHQLSRGMHGKHRNPDIHRLCRHQRRGDRS